MPNANVPQPIEVLRAGTHTDSNGVRVTITDADLQRIADTYSPALHEAPYVVGHPRMDGPAYGWASRFSYRDGVLLAESSDVEEQFAGLVNEGRFKKVSLALYGPKAPGNPAPGSWYPRHVGFLGAMPPAIKGLKSVQFAEGESGVHEFGDYAERTVIGILRRMRDWFIGQHGQEVADRVIPDYELTYATEEVAADMARDNMTSEGGAPVFSEGSPPAGTGADDMSAQQLADLQARLDLAQQQLADRAAADREQQQQARQASAVAFAEGAIGAARVPTERREQLVALHLQLAAGADGAVVMFGEGDSAVAATKVLADLVALIPPAVEFGEHATHQARGAALDDLDDADAQVQFAEGVRLDDERMGLHNQVLEIQRAARTSGKPLTYSEALAKVRR
jgi:hypothetical protein